MKDLMTEKTRTKVLITSGVLLALLFIAFFIFFIEAGLTRDNREETGGDEIVPTRVVYTAPTSFYDAILSAPPSPTSGLISPSPTVLDVKIASLQECNVRGEPVIDISQKVINDYDIGSDGNAWAVDTYTQNITVWRMSGFVDTYCVDATIEGEFDALSDRRSPGDKSKYLAGSEDGVIEGSSRSTIIGKLKSNPTWPMSGSVPMADFTCLYLGNCEPDVVNFWDQAYFDDIQPGYPKTDWYVWYMKNGDNVWAATSEGNQGDVL